MTRGRLKVKLAQLVEKIPGTLVSMGDWQKLNAMIDERLIQFSRRGLTIWDSKVTLTTEQDEPLIDLRDLTVLDLRIAHPVDVFIKRVALTDFEGRRRRETIPMIVEVIPSFPEAESGTPRMWVYEKWNRIRLVDAPDEDDMDDCWISGWVEHVEIGGQTTLADNWAVDAQDLIDINPDDEDKLVEFVALDVIPKSERMYVDLEARCDAWLEDSRSESFRRHRGSTVRGRFNHGTIRSIGR